MITKQFILAGRAIFTLECSPEYRTVNVWAKPHYTFRVVHKQANGDFPEAWFAYLLAGPQNTTDYQYVGQISPAGELKLTGKSRFNDSTVPVKLLRRVLARVWAGENAAIEAAGFKLHHEGRCARCGRVLTVPESVASGFGPECAGRIDNG